MLPGLLLWLFSAVVCPPGMVASGVGWSCIEILPWPGYADTLPMVGMSAIPETYLNLGGLTQDSNALCHSRGRRLCTSTEWRSACEGTARASCPGLKSYLVPNWHKVALRDRDEMFRLFQASDWRDYPDCIGRTGARMMLGHIEEWVRDSYGYALHGDFWSRQRQCDRFIRSHGPNWHDYASGTRCCYDP